MPGQQASFGQVTDVLVRFWVFPELGTSQSDRTTLKVASGVFMAVIGLWYMGLLKVSYICPDREAPCFRDHGKQSPAH